LRAAASPTFPIVGKNLNNSQNTYTLNLRL
jgi:hypothetical protein